MTATFTRVEADPVYAADGATDTELAAAVAAVETALAAKQASATAATDAELASAVEDLVILLAAKQDSSTAATDSEVAAAIAAHAAGAATDAELAAAVAILNTSIGLKQDASTAATDSELAAALSGQSLATVDNIAAYTAPSSGANDVPGSTSAVVTTPASGRLRAEAFTPWLSGDVAGSAVVLAIHEAPVVNGVQGAFTEVQRGIWSNVTAGKGAAMLVSAPLSHAPGAQYVYKLVVYAYNGTSKPTVSALGLTGKTYLDITAR